jgi:hypothetical protein
MCPDPLGQTDLMWDKLGSTLEALPSSPNPNRLVTTKTLMWSRVGTHRSGTRRPGEESTEKSCNIEETYLLIIGKWVRWVPASSITAAASIQPFIFAII